MILFQLISWPYARTHVLRSLLTILGISFGVAVFVSMHLANQSVLGAFAETVNRIAGAAQLQITAGEPGFDEEVLERVTGTVCPTAGTEMVISPVSVPRADTRTPSTARLWTPLRVPEAVISSS